MTIMISVSPKAEAALKERAAASGKELDVYASELLERAAVEAPDQVQPPGQICLDEWQTRSQAFLAMMRDFLKQRPAHAILDDSRDAIYAGRGE
jgi:hypothetical protein